METDKGPHNEHDAPRSPLRRRRLRDTDGNAIEARRAAPPETLRQPQSVSEGGRRPEPEIRCARRSTWIPPRTRNRKQQQTNEGQATNERRRALRRRRSATTRGSERTGDLPMPRSEETPTRTRLALEAECTVRLRRGEKMTTNVAGATRETATEGNWRNNGDKKAQANSDREQKRREKRPRNGRGRCEEKQMRRETPWGRGRDDKTKRWRRVSLGDNRRRGGEVVAAGGGARRKDKNKQTTK